MASDGQNIKTLGRYALREEIGRGGMATVYRGYDSSLKREVAVKVLHAHLVTHQEARARFEREARSVARLHHPSIVEIYDYAETDNGEVFIVMELVEGYTLREFLNERNGHPLMAEGAALIARQIFIAMQIAHDEGIIHRDVKPENILISRDGKIQLSDFGIAFLAGIGQMTATGQILGSPTYMSPEHIESPSVDVRADIFSLGSILYEMVVGQPPFIGNNPHQIIKRVVEGYYDHPLSVNPSVGHPVSSVIVKCLQQQPDRRYQSASEAISDLETILNQMGIKDLDKEQKKYVANPQEWEDSHLSEIVVRTLQMGKEAQKNKQLPEAMNHLNRVLAIEPANEVALGAVNVLSRRRRFRRNIERVGSVAVIVVIMLAAVAGFIIYRYTKGPSRNLNDSSEFSTDMPTDNDIVPISDDTQKEEASTEIETIHGERKVIIINEDTSDADLDEMDSDTATETDQEISADTATTGRLASEHHKKIRPPVIPAEVETRKVVFNPLPMSVDIVIDNTRKFTFKATDRARDLTVGTHVIKFVPIDERLETLTQTITVDPSETPLTVPARLRWKSAQLLIHSDVSAEVAVNGRSLGQTNIPIELDIKKGPDTQFRILLSARGYHPIEKLVSVSAGKTTEIVVQLEKEQL